MTELVAMFFVGTIFGLTLAAILSILRAKRHEHLREYEEAYERCLRKQEESKRRIDRDDPANYWKYGPPESDE